MKLHTVFITYNRLELTKQAVLSYLDTVSVPYTWIVVDNASTDGTREWVVNTFGARYLLPLPQNRYPGYACNRGWEIAPAEADMLHRADNDFEFLPGWCDIVRESFTLDIGQLGLRTDEEELHNSNNVGGNCIVRRRLWDKGLRYDETPWPEIPVVGYTEDSFMSPNVKLLGWKWGRVLRPCIRPIGFESPDDPYYQQTWADRGISR